MASFISAGHHLKDSGATGNGYKENELTIEFRNLVVSHCLKKGMKVITDKDTETLGQYLSRIQTGSGSVVIEFHFDASVNKTATGTTALVGDDADRLDKSFAQELVNTTSKVLGIKNRGVLSENMSHRGKLGLMRKQGTVALLEIAFISNKSDMEAYQKNKKVLASLVADVIYKYENLA